MTDDFPTLPAGMLSEQVDLPELRMTLGLLHKEGAGLRVCSWDGHFLRHMSPAAARRLATELETSGFQGMLLPAIQAVRGLADRVDEILASIAAPVLADMPAEGHA